MEAAKLVRVELTRRPERMEPRAPERLVDVDVPEPRNRPLIEKRRLERGLAPLEASTERPGRERAASGSGPIRAAR